MRIFVTGGTGFVGTEVLSRLVRAEHEVVALVRDPDRLTVRGVAQVVEGDVTRPDSYHQALENCQACVHLVGILREFPGQGITFEKLHYQATVDLLRSCSRFGVKRFLHMSANGAERAIQTGYMVSKAKEEEAVRASALDWTIFRPSVVYGGREDRPSFVSTLVDSMKRLPLLPYFGDGSYRLAPVSVTEVASAFVAALERPESIKQAYHLCGPEVYTYRAVLTMLREAGGHKVRLIPFPFWLMEAASGVLGGFSWFPVTDGMLRMLKEGNTCPESGLTHIDLGVGPRSFEAWLYEREGQPLESKNTRMIAGEPTITRTLESEDQPLS
ncbi:MAG: complex I NDUFA9 subunit family protein [Vulcanimicrobiota bacterium]